MKKLLLFLMLIAACVSATAQDVIVKKDGSTVLCKIIQVNDNEVVYLKWSELKGPQYIMDSSLVSNINYQDGRQDKLNEQTTNSYAPGIQQTGDAQYNDNALLALDRARNNTADINYTKKAKNLKIIGWTVGLPVFLTGAVILLPIGFDAYGTAGYQPKGCQIGGIACILVGAATTTTCLIYANKYKNMANSLNSFSLVSKEILNGKNLDLTASMDLIQNRHFQNSSVGIGIQVNFK